MRAWDNSQRAGLSTDGVEIKGDFDEPSNCVESVAVPPSVTRIEIPIAAYIVEIGSQQTCCQAFNTRMVKKFRETLSRVDKRYDAGPLHIVVDQPSIHKYRLEFTSYPVDIVFKNARQHQVPKRVKETNLLFGQPAHSHIMEDVSRLFEACETF